MSDRSDFYWGDTAESYDAKRRDSSIWRREDEVIGEILSTFLPERDAARIILDIPVGTGRFAQLIGRSGHTLVGVDISEDMLRQAKEKAVSPSMFAMGSANELPIGTSSVDAAICVRFAHLVQRRLLQGTLKELRRVLKDDGVAVMGIRMHSMGTDDLDGRWRRGLQRLARSSRFQLGRANSHSHSRRWFLRALSAADLMPSRQWQVTRYADGSSYMMLLLRPAAKASRRAPSIELFGLPGVGKTTVGRSLVRADELGLVDGFKSADRLSLLQCFRRHPLATARFMARLIPVYGELGGDPARRVVIAALRQRLADVEAIGTVIHEEGACHEAWRQLFLRKTLSDGLLSNVIPASKTVVFMEAPVPDLIERLATKRSPGPISRSLRSASSDDETWTHATASYQRIKDVILSATRTTHTVENSAQTEAVSAAELGRIVDKMEREFRS